MSLRFAFRDGTRTSYYQRAGRFGSLVVVSNEGCWVQIGEDFLVRRAGVAHGRDGLRVFRRFHFLRPFFQGDVIR